MTDIVFLIEHKDREVGLVDKIARKITQETGLSTCVLSLIFDLHRLMGMKPKLVVVPAALSQETWPLRFVREVYDESVPIVSLTWEQMLFGIMEYYKRPRDEFIKQKVRHIAWNKGFKSYLMSHGVLEENIHICGNPKLEDMTYSAEDLRKCREKISGVVDLSSYRQIVFMPMNLSWAWHTDEQVQAKINQGFPTEAGWEYRDFAQKNLAAFIEFFISMAQREDRLIIVRPHPSIIPAQYIEAFRKRGFDIPDNIKITKEFTVREWTVVADLIGSSWSTVCYDAQSIGKAAFLYAPYPRPEWMDTWWTNATPNFKTPAEFEAFASTARSEVIPKESSLIFSDEVARTLPRLITGNKTHITFSKISAASWKIIFKRFLLGYLLQFGVRPDKKPDYFKPLMHKR